MKIAILADPLDNQNAGVHTYTQKLVSALIQYDDINEYVLIREKKDPALPSKIQQIAVSNIRRLLPYAALRMFVIIPIVLRRLKVDAVVEPAHFGPFNLPRRIYRITVIHDLTAILFPHFHRRHSQILQRIFLRGILKRADLILTVSQHSSKDLARFFSFTDKKTVVIPPAHDSFYQPVSSRAVLEKWQINAPYFLSVSTIEPRKNLTILLRVYQRFREQNDSRVLLILVGGKGWKYQSFYDELARHPYRKDILMAGFVDEEDLPTLYSHTLALVYPSLYEGFGMPVLEAMACGAVVICSERSSMPEVGKSAALYFDPEDEAGLLQHMQAVAQNESLAMERRMLSLQEASTFSWENYVRMFMEAIGNLGSR